MERHIAEKTISQTVQYLVRLNPFQYKKGFSKVNSLFCTVKAIHDRVVFHI